MYVFVCVCKGEGRGGREGERGGGADLERAASVFSSGNSSGSHTRPTVHWNSTCCYVVAMFIVVVLMH